VRQESMAGRQVDDAAASKDAADPPCHLPRLVELLARQAACVAYGARQAIEERVCGKPPQVVVGKATLGGEGKRRILQSEFLPYPCP